VFNGSSQPVIGVASEADLISINVFSLRTGAANCSGAASCIRTWQSDQLAALDYIHTTLVPSFDIASVNMSLGGSTHFSSHCDTDARKAAIDTLRAEGIATIISSGNESSKTGISAPACISSAVSVGATGDNNDNVASFSNSASILDLLAPGVSIQAGYPGNALVTANGTSMAAPHVSGLFAVLNSIDPGSSVDERIAAVQASGVPVTDTANGVITPRIDVPAAIAALGGPGLGAGIANDGNLTLTYTTVTANSSPWGGGLAGDGSTTLRGTVIADQLGGPDCSLSSPATSGGRNADSDGSCDLAGAGDLSGVDAQLGALADNGGATATHLPAAASPLVNAIPSGTAQLCDGTHVVDQRSTARPKAVDCDIGAVER
jgi:subtilisin family serine protease